MSDLIKLRWAQTTVDRQSETLVAGVPVYDEEEQALYIRGGETAGGIKAVGAAGTVPQLKTQACSTADAVTIYWRPSTSGNTLLLTVAAGTGIYTKPIVLHRETREDGAPTGAAVATGTRVTVGVQFSTTSAGRVVEIRENASGGDILDTFTSDTEEAWSGQFEYVFNGSAWVKIGGFRHTA